MKVISKKEIYVADDEDTEIWQSIASQRWIVCSHPFSSHFPQHLWVENLSGIVWQHKFCKWWRLHFRVENTVHIFWKKLMSFHTGEDWFLVVTEKSPCIHNTISSPHTLGAVNSFASNTQESFSIEDVFKGVPSLLKEVLLWARKLPKYASVVNYCNK